MQLLSCSAAISATGIAPSALLFRRQRQTEKCSGIRCPDGISWMQIARVSRANVGRNISRLQGLCGNTCRHRANPEKLTKQGREIFCSAKQQDEERRSSNGSASSSSSQRKPFVANDGNPKPGVYVISSPGKRLNPQDESFVSSPPEGRHSEASLGERKIGPSAKSNRTEASGNDASRTSANNGSSGSADRVRGTSEDDVRNTSEDDVSGVRAAVLTGPASDQITDAPSCPNPNFATTATRVTLLQPVPLLPSSAQNASVNKRPLLVYVPGMDGTGQGIRPQIEGLYTDGYDIRCVYIPSSDRSTWDELVDSLVPLIEEAALPSDSEAVSSVSRAALLQYAHGARAQLEVGDEVSAPPTRHVTLLAESFGTCLALRVAARAPRLISRLVLLNPATNFDSNNRLVSLAAATGLLAAFPGPLYSFAQDVMLPLLVKRNRVSADANKDLLSPIDYVPAACAAWRLQMLNEGTPSPEALAAIRQPTMLCAGAKDRVLPSMTEAARLQTQLSNAWRVILPESGHTALLEDQINISKLMRKNGFAPPRSISDSDESSKPQTSAPSPVDSPDLTELAARDPADPTVIALNPGVSEAVNSVNPRVRESINSVNNVVTSRALKEAVGSPVDPQADTSTIRVKAPENGNGNGQAHGKRTDNGNGKPRQLDPKAGGRSDVDSGAGVSSVRYDDVIPQRRRAAVPDEVYDEMGRLLEPWRIVTSPLFSGSENLPDPNAEPRRPVLFVGNHTIFGLYDSPLLVHELFLRGFRCRGLAHPGHWMSGAGELFERYGNVKATPFAAYKLLKEGEDVLLFPGGAREVVKRKGEEYQLQWKEKADFVRMASRLGAIIVPFGALGGDDAYKILWDARDILNSPVGPAVEQLYKMVGLGPELVYPVTRLPIPGLPIPSPIPIPAIERIYFHFAPAIDTTEHACDLADVDACQDLYISVRRSVEESIAHLKEVRARDPERMFPARMLAKASRLLPEFSPRE